MPRLISEINGSGSVGIASDSIDLGAMKTLNYEANRIKFDSTSGVATVFSNPLTIIGL